jgi:hypothetical protein
MSEETTEPEERLPRPGDRLFPEMAPPHEELVARNPAERFYRIPVGFKRAGDLLAEQARVSITDRRNVIFPMLYCYRQAIEMYLKRLIDKFGDGSFPNTHNLRTLWADHVEKLLRARSFYEASGADAAAHLVMEMHDADQQSDGFRYPIDRKRAPFPFGDRGIDLENLQEVMTGLANFFECVELALEHEGG